MISPIIDEKKGFFQIVSEPSIDLGISLNKKVFVLGENIVISFVSSVDPDIEARLVYPDRSV